MRHFAPTLLLLLLCSLVTTQVLGAQQTHIISLHYRSAIEMIPILEPLLDKDGVITAAQDKLVIRASKENIRDIEKVLKEIDVAAKRLRISVTLDAARVREEQRSQGQLTIDQRGASAQVQIYSTQPRYQGVSTQAIQTTEGQWSSLQTGQAIPIVERQKNPDGSVSETTRYKDVTQGFDVLPRVSGQQVTLSIRPRMSHLSREGGGKLEVQQMETTLSGKLGEWMSIGGIVSNEHAFQNDGHLSTRRHTDDKDELYVKVDLLP